MYIHAYSVHVHTCTKAGMNSQYQIRRFARVFNNFLSMLLSPSLAIEKLQKLDYCFIMSTSLVHVAVSTLAGLKNENTPILLTTHLDCTIAHANLDCTRSFDHLKLFPSHNT